MIKATAKLVHKLRLLLFIIIILGFFYQLGVNPVDVSRFFGAKVGRAVGISVSIPENPFNRLAAQLKEKEERLAKKEAELEKREEALAPVPAADPMVFYAMGGGIIVLFLLIGLNFYLDFHRKRRSRLSDTSNKT